MKKIFLLTWITLLFSGVFGQIAVGVETANPSAIIDLDVSSHPQNGKKGFLPPRMTAKERMDIPEPAEGLMIYNTSDKCLNFFNGQAWVNPCTGSVEYPPPLPLNFRLGGNAQDFIYFTSVQLTLDGGFIITATSSSSNSGNVSDFNHGDFDIWMVKLNSTGAIEWEKLMGGSGYDRANAVQQTSDGGYIVGAYSTSSSSGTVSGVNHGLEDYWVIKLDAEGNIIWEKLLGGSGTDYLQSILQLSDGGYLVSGHSNSSSSGNVSGTNRGSSDYWVVRLDASGNIVWNKLMGGAQSETEPSIIATADGNYILAGKTLSSISGDVTGTNHGNYDMWLVKINDSGTILWNKLFGGSGADYHRSLKLTSDNGFIVSGYTTSSANGDVSGTNNGSNDYWVIKLNASGNKEWDKILGGSGSDIVNSVIITNDGNYVLAGYSNSSNSGNVSMISHGSYDYWIIKLDSSGTLIWENLFGGNGDEVPFSIFQNPDGSYTIFGYSENESVGNGNQVNLLGRGGIDVWIIRINKDGEIIQ